jgi:hypothetical protein
MATAITKGFSVGDTVYVRYPYAGTSVGWTPASRVVTAIDFIAASNECVVKFSNGNDVTDGAVQRVYTTQALCATAIVTDIISNATAACLLDPTTSGASTAGQPTTSLIRND